MQIIHLAVNLLHMLALSGCAITVVSVDDLLTPRSRLAAIHPPRLDQPPIIMDTHIPLTQPPIQRPLRIAPAEVPRSARVGERLISLDNDREVELDVLRWDALYRREKTVAVRAVADGARRHATKAYLVEQVELSGGLEARVE